MYKENILYCLLAFVVLTVSSCNRNTRNLKSHAKIRISKETTYLVSPKMGNGRIDYVEEINQRYGRGITADQNAAAIYMQAIGPNLLDFGEQVLDDSFVDGVLNKLDIDDLPQDGNYLTLFPDFVAKRRGQTATISGSESIRAEYASQLRPARRGPWSRAEFPIIADWVDSNSHPIDVISKGALEVPDFSSEPCRRIGDLLTTRAMLRLQRGP